MLTKKLIIDCLKTILDPEINLDIWTMGIIYGIDIKDDNEVKILMTYTTPFCPYGGVLTEQVKDKLRDLGCKTVNVEVTFDPPWQPSEELRVALGI